MKKCFVLITVLSVGVLSFIWMNNDNLRKVSNEILLANIDALADSEGCSGCAERKENITEQQGPYWGYINGKYTEYYRIVNFVNCIGLGYVPCTPSFSETFVTSK